MMVPDAEYVTPAPSSSSTSLDSVYWLIHNEPIVSWAMTGLVLLVVVLAICLYSAHFD